MTVTSADTAELPRVRAVTVDSPALPAPDFSDPPAPIRSVRPTRAESGTPTVITAPVLAPTGPAARASGFTVPGFTVPDGTVPDGLPAPDPASTGAAPAPPGGSARAEIRAERLHQRRVRRLWTAFSITVLASSLAGTVVILDLLH